MQAKTKPQSRRILELDALRALAAINLLLFHFTLVFPNKYGFHESLGFSFPYGKYGVQLFFMLSGFVNAMTLLRKRQPTEFIIARWIRIFPTYWAVIALNLLLLSSFSMYGVEVTSEAAIANASVLPNLFGYESWEPVTWTLQVEMLFYFILMILFVGGALQNTLRTMMLLCGISLFGVPLIHHWQTVAPDSAHALVGRFLGDLFILKYLPLFATGILIHEIWARRSKLIPNLVGILVAAIVFHYIDLKAHNPVVTVLILATLFLSAYGKLPVLRWKPLMFVSGISYALYLFHNNLGCLLIRWIHDAGLPPLPSIIVATIFSVVMATLITRWFEQPTTKALKSLWQKAREKFQAPPLPKSTSVATDS